jgi:hypothetical protein
MAEMLSNVIGAPFSEYVLTQLSLRSTHNSSTTRTNEEVLFIANKTAWVRLTSSVQINKKQETINATIDAGTLPGFKAVTIKALNPLLKKYYQDLLGTSATGYDTSDSLRKNWILEAGTSKSTGAGVDLRYGLGEEGSYGLGGTEELGYRPMPGLTSVEVSTVGTLGSLKEANIKFQVWNINQLNAVEALYFRLGYSMILEWGHTQFYSNVGPANQGKFITSPYGLDLFSNTSLRKEQIQQQIYKKSYDTSGNYQGMFGIVSNFNWSMNQEGGYDCTVKLVGLGAIVDSLRINSSYKMPDSLQKIYDQQQARLKRQQEEDAERKIQNDRQKTGLTAVPVAAPKSVNDLYTLYQVDLGKSATDNQKDFLNRISYYSDYQLDNTRVNTIPDYYYEAVKGGDLSVSQQKVEINKVSGLFITSKDSTLTLRKFISADTAPNYAQPITFDFTYLRKRYADFSNYSITGAEGINILTTLLSLFANISTIDNIQKAAKKVPNTPIKDSLVGANTILLATSSNKITTLAEAYQAALKSKYENDFITEEVTVVLPYLGKIPGGAETISKPFFIAIKYTPTGQKYTAADLGIDFLAPWLEGKGQNGTPSLEIVSIKTEKVNLDTQGTYNDLYIVGNVDTLSLQTGISANTIPPTLQIITNDTNYIASVLPRSEKQTVTTQNTQTANDGNTVGDINGVTSNQVDPAMRLDSALHIMLNVVQSQLRNEVAGSEDVVKVSLLPTTKLLYDDGILKGILTGNPTKDPKSVKPITPTLLVKEFDLTQYALKGFNSNLMTNPELYLNIAPVKFETLCDGYAIPYKQKDETGPPSYFTYIKFGYLLAFLNNMCLIYDSTQDTSKHPYVYIDFNPETNLCLSNPQHLSVDPYTCIIPFNGTDVDYIKIFPDGYAQSSLSDKFGNAPLTKAIDKVSSKIEGFKNTNLYQGKTMEILLNIDFLLDTLKQYTTSDKEHSVNLKGFLDAIVTGINKSTGNINLFRVAYRDDSNTVIIKDDQFVPALPEEAWSLASTNGDPVAYSNTTGPKVARFGQLPVFGLKSLVREMQFQTDLSTAISNQIAISAQANTGSVNSTDHSFFSYLNVNYTDTYKPFVQDVAVTKITAPKKNTGKGTEETEQDRIEINDIKLAGQFNQHVISIYSINGNLSKTKVDMAINYYINSMAKIKSDDGITVAAPFIPANLSLTLDGISGIIMGQAFTIPESRLPLSLRGDGNYTKVGFIVVGLTDVIQNNQWLTKIRGQMIKLRDTTDYAKRIVSSTPAGTEKNNSTRPPWSAAFISYVMKTAGVTSFPVNSNHLAYAQSLRVNNNGFTALDTTKYKLQVGDLIVTGRDGNNVSFGTAKWSGNGHGDIIVDINGNTALKIGGNEGGKVSKTSSTLTADGRLGRSDFFVILRPDPSFVKSIVNTAEAEYKKWKDGNWIETTPAALKSLNSYYAVVNL